MSDFPLTVHCTRPDGGREIEHVQGIGVGRSVVVLAVHHVHVGGIEYTGGAEKFILTAVRGLLESGARVHIGYSGTSIYEDLLDRYHPSRLTVECTGWVDEVMSGDRIAEARRVLDRVKWFKAAAADTALFVQQASGSAFVASVLGARLAGLKVVTTIRQPPPEMPAAGRLAGVLPAPNRWRRRMLRPYRRAAWWSHRLVYNSEAIAAAYEDALGFSRRKRWVVCNGAPVADGVERRRARHRFGAVGRLTEAKGAFDLLRAFAVVAGAVPSATLDFYGDGPARQSLQDLVASVGLDGRVRFMGHVKDRTKIFSAIDVYVHASHRESMPNSVIEAMGRGIPCVATDVGGTREAVINEETGLLVPAHDTAALAAAMRRMVEDRALFERCGDNALSRARAEYDERKTLPRLMTAILGARAGLLHKVAC